MNRRKRVAQWLAGKLTAHAATRPPSVVIREQYMKRWHLIPRNPLFNIYYHEFEGPDLPMFHDHPWINLSFVLEGEFIEHTPPRWARPFVLRNPRLATNWAHTEVRGPGSLVFRLPRALHWLEPKTRVVRTLFITGPRIRVWGFLCPERGWVPWYTIVKKRGNHQTTEEC